MGNGNGWENGVHPFPCPIQKCSPLKYMGFSFRAWRTEMDGKHVGFVHPFPCPIQKRSPLLVADYTGEERDWIAYRRMTSRSPSSDVTEIISLWTKRKLNQFTMIQEQISLSEKRKWVTTGHHQSTPNCLKHAPDFVPYFVMNKTKIEPIHFDGRTNFVVRKRKIFRYGQNENWTNSLGWKNQFRCQK